MQNNNNNNKNASVCSRIYVKANYKNKCGFVSEQLNNCRFKNNDSRDDIIKQELILE